VPFGCGAGPDRSIPSFTGTESRTIFKKHPNLGQKGSKMPRVPRPKSSVPKARPPSTVPPSRAAGLSETLAGLKAALAKLGAGLVGATAGMLGNLVGPLGSLRDSAAEGDPEAEKAYEEAIAMLRNSESSGAQELLKEMEEGEAGGEAQAGGEESSLRETSEGEQVAEHVLGAGAAEEGAPRSGAAEERKQTPLEGQPKRPRKRTDPKKAAGAKASQPERPKKVRSRTKEKGRAGRGGEGGTAREKSE
jgi:hypothetical protein